MSQHLRLFVCLALPALVACGSNKAPPPAEDAGEEAPCGGACAAPAPYCDVEFGRCRACRPGEGCSGATPVCDLAAAEGVGACVQCTDDSHCPSATPLCNQDSSTCFAAPDPADAGPPGESCANERAVEFPAGGS